MKKIMFAIIFMLSSTYFLFINDINVEAKTSEVFKNKSSKIIKKIHYYDNGNIKQILTYKYYKNGHKKQTISKRYHKKSEKLKWYAKYKYTNSKKAKYKSKLMKKYNHYGTIEYMKIYKYKTDNLIRHSKVNVYRLKKYNKGILKSDKTLYVDYKNKLKVFKYITEYTTINKKATKHRFLAYDYRLNKQNKYKNKTVHYFSENEIYYRYSYNKSGELKSNKNGKAYFYKYDYSKMVYTTYQYDSNGKKNYKSGPDPISNLPLT